MINRIIALIAVMTIMLLGGCATSRSVVTVNGTPQDTAANPERGTAIRFETEDVRVFEAKPATPDIPSLKNGEITNESITSRAIARKRNSYGRGLGDVLLPEGQTVAKLIENAVASSFREAGYRVLTSSDPGFDKALPVDTKINQYWSWMNPGFWAITLSCRTEVTITAPIAGFEDGRKITALAENSMQAAFESAWQEIATEGLTELKRSLSRSIPREVASN